MNTEAERQTFTAALWAKHGDDLPRYIATRVGEQVTAGDLGGVGFWRDIAARAEAMMRSPLQ
ncbi:MULTISPECIES: DUF6961 family protein [unclassified Sphingomonas]|uniref:DUF6961 family protein n=1 Tax=unclassified Sphingomonas TaxID=196159 RepID=UPI002150F15B|nr:MULTISPECIES: hypothetical protein [unclassified Sphingomonas]MCR5872268.1 hypothetical protein [Sphingomonas sp. J344]UUX99432.1 hypothetical protein LRS08_18640 [Sphingomonas sp. J315]